MSPTCKRIAVVGGGASGLLTAWLLQEQHEVTLFEARSALGGHVRTVPVDVGDRAVFAEAGFKYFFDRTNPYLLAVLDELGLGIEWTSAAMTLPHEDVEGDLVIPPTSGRQLRHLLGAPTALRDIVTLSTLRLAHDEVVLRGDTRLTVEDLLRWRRFPDSTHAFLYSFMCSSWGVPHDVMAHFPAYNVLTLLSSPGARYKRVGYLERGGAAYIDALAARLSRTARHLGDPVTRVERADGQWWVSAVEARPYDAVVLALPPWRAANILVGADAWRAALASFECFETRTAVHRDATFMPDDRRDWSLSNVYRSAGRPLLTSWEGIRYGEDVFRSWLLADEPRDVVREEAFEHLVVDGRSADRRDAVDALQGRGELFAVGMYTGVVDCHESCVTSAVAAARRLAPGSAALHRLVTAAEARRRDEERAARSRLALAIERGNRASRRLLGPRLRRGS